MLRQGPEPDDMLSRSVSRRFRSSYVGTESTIRTLQHTIDLCGENWTVFHEHVILPARVHVCSDRDQNLTTCCPVVCREDFAAAMLVLSLPFARYSIQSTCAVKIGRFSPNMLFFPHACTYAQT